MPFDSIPEAPVFQFRNRAGGLEMELSEEFGCLSALSALD
jgi:hypothetical protein